MLIRIGTVSQSERFPGVNQNERMRKSERKESGFGIATVLGAECRLWEIGKTQDVQSEHGCVRYPNFMKAKSE